MTITRDRLGHYFATDSVQPTPAERDAHAQRMAEHRPRCASTCFGPPQEAVHRAPWQTDDQWAIYVAGWFEGRV